MKRWLPWIAIVLLAWAGPAQAGDIEEMEERVQRAAVHVENLLVQAAAEEDPARQAERREQIEEARAHWQELMERLEAIRAARSSEAQNLRVQAAALRAQAEEMRAHLEHLAAQAEETREASAEAERPDHAAAAERRLQEVREAMVRLESARELLVHTMARFEQGDHEGARARLQGAIQRMHEVRAALEARENPEHDRRPPPDADPHARLEHLRAAAHHLHEAGAHEEAEELEREIHRMEDHLDRERHGDGPSPEALLEAIRGLRHEVHALREEVREIKGILTRRRAR